MRPASRPPRVDYRARLFQTYASTFSGVAAPLSSADLHAAAIRYQTQVGHLLPASRDASILEVGCGPGRFLWYLSRQGYTRVRGIDFSPEQVSRAEALSLQGVEQAEASYWARKLRPSQAAR